MKSEVFYYSDAKNIRKGVDLFLKIIRKDFGDDRLGFKTHFGEKGNTTHLKPKWMTGIKKFFSNPVFVECNVLYKGSRTCRKDHLNVAAEHGFDFIEIDILDGELGEEFSEVELVLRDNKAFLGSGILKYNNLVALSHFKGHLATGFGGALKNIGMGLSSRSGKMQMHSIISPIVDETCCTGCGICVSNCDFNAIKLEKTANIIMELCAGCARCIAVCPEGAMGIPWDMSDSVNQDLMEAIADYVLAATHNRQWWYINFLVQITLDCDCMPYEQKPVIDDIGLLASKDPIAIDQASLDLVIKNNNGVDVFHKHNKVNSSYILNYGEKIGLGSREYELKDIC